MNEFPSEPEIKEPELTPDEVLSGDTSRAMAESLSGKSFELLTSDEKQILVGLIDDVRDRAHQEIAGSNLSEDQTIKYVNGRVLEEILGTLTSEKQRKLSLNERNQLDETTSQAFRTMAGTEPSRMDGFRSEAVQ